MGVERNQNGGQAIAAILAMPALLGKFGVPGGGYTLSNSAAARMDKDKIFGKIAWNTRLLNQTRLGRLLNEPLEPPVKGLFVYAAIRRPRCRIRMPFCAAWAVRICSPWSLSR